MGSILCFYQYENNKSGQNLQTRTATDMFPIFCAKAKVKIAIIFIVYIFISQLSPALSVHVQSVVENVIRSIYMKCKKADARGICSQKHRRQKLLWAEMAAAKEGFSQQATLALAAPQCTVAQTRSGGDICLLCLNVTDRWFTKSPSVFNLLFPKRLVRALYQMGL